MAELLWPGDERAGAVFTDAAVLAAMVRVEAAWLDSLATCGIAPSSASLDGTVTADDLVAITAESESIGNPVGPLASLLRSRIDDDAARWLHRGLTSQDVLDTALLLCAGESLDRVAAALRFQTQVLVALIDEHRGTVMTGRTLTQPAVPITFALKAAVWLGGVLDAGEDVERARASLRVQAGGAAGTMAALVSLAGGVEAARTVTERFAASLGLSVSAPWATNRTPITRAAHAFASATTAWGHIASDVLTLGRPEIGELREGAVAGRGGSSTMPQKANPVLSVLIKRAAIGAPSDAAAVAQAAALVVDERPDGAWHAEWQPLARLARHGVAAGEQTSELLTNLHVDNERMRANLSDASPAIFAERDAMLELGGTDDGDYLGASDAFVDETLKRAR